MFNVNTRSRRTQKGSESSRCSSECCNAGAGASVCVRCVWDVGPWNGPEEGRV